MVIPQGFILGSFLFLCVNFLTDGLACIYGDLIIYVHLQQKRALGHVSEGWQNILNRIFGVASICNFEVES